MTAKGMSVRSKYGSERHRTRIVPIKPNKFASRMLRLKGRASSAVEVSEENLFKTLPAAAQHPLQFGFRTVHVLCMPFEVCQLTHVFCSVALAAGQNYWSC